MIDSFKEEHRWLSNFWYCRVELDGITYSSVEAAYVAAKTLNTAEREHVRSLKTPAEAKSYGRGLELREDWEDVKIEIMLNLLRQKFSAQNSALRQKLIDTSHQELIEGNTWGDMFWGQCYGVGQNNLGKLLMQVRDELIMDKITNSTWWPSEFV